MDKVIKENIISLFQSYPEVGLVYFFGSRARGESGPLSDYDFAVYLDSRDRQKMFDIKLEIQDRLNRILIPGEADVVVLNTAESPELKYEIINGGELIFEREPFKVLIEPRIYSEYFDFRDMLRRHQLTNA